MHLKAIQIKEMLLGQEDYEVALSLGHLASLYNYHMHHYRKAEELYLRSIAIGKLLPGLMRGEFSCDRTPTQKIIFTSIARAILSLLVCSF